MADKDFGVKRISLIGASGTPTITSPNNLNINANTVAISTNISIGGQVNSDLKIGNSFFVGIGSTVPTVKLDVIGDGKFTGSITASSILGTALSVSGISTFTNGPVLIGGGTSTGTLGQVFQVTGINSGAYIGGNLGIGSTNPTSKLWVEGDGKFSGIVTSATFNSTVGIITYITGVAATITNFNSTVGIITNITGVAGTITNFNSTVGIITNLTGTNLNYTGISTLGITSATDLTIQQLNVSGISTFTNGPVLIGGGTSTGTSDQVLQVNSGVYVSGNLGIGSTNPTVKLWVNGDGYFIGSVTSAKGFYVNGELVGSGGITGANIVGTALSISGISTFGGFDGILIKSENGLGIITSANIGVGTVFYYGDGSKLTGIGTAAQSQSVSVSIDQSDETTSIIFVSDPTISVASTLKTNPNLVFNAAGNRLGIGTTNPITTLHIGGKTYIDGNLGIGTTNPQQKLWVEGNGYFSGIVTSAGFYVDGQLVGSGSISGGSIVGTALSISGISTLSTVKISSGIITSTNPGVGTVVYYGDFYGKINGQVSVQGNSIGAALTAVNVIGGIASVSQLSVSGVSTVGVLTATNIGIGTTNPSSALWIGGDIFVSGISTLGITSATDLTSKQLNVSGIATVGVGSTGVKIDGIAGIITSSNPGITTVVYYGDGSKLTGIGSAATAQSVALSTNTTTTNASIVFSQIPDANPTANLNSNPNLIFNAATSSLGIGTTNPQQKLWVEGNGYFSGIVTSAGFYVDGQLVGSGSISGGSIVGTALSISGIATVGVGSTGIKIDGIAGIITSSNPGVTTVVYYGDGSKLTGNISNSITNIDVDKIYYPLLSQNISGTISSITISSTSIVFNPGPNYLGIGSTTPTTNLDVLGSIKASNNLNVSGTSTLGNVQIEGGKITAASGIVTYYGDGSKLTNLTANIGDLYELDDISYATNNDKNTFTPTYNYDTVSVENPFKLLITINGVLQSAYIHNAEYVWNNNLLCTNDGYTIDYDGNIKFTEPLLVGTQVVIKTAVGSNTPLPRKYPFKPLDVMF